MRRRVDCRAEKKKVATPLPSGYQYRKRGEVEGRGHNHAYLRACGKLIWLLKTRPDAAYAINCLCRNMSNSTEEDDQTANWLARYFSGKLIFGLKFTLLPSPLNTCLCGFVDASYVDGRQSKSTGNWMLAFGDRHHIGAVIEVKTFVQRLPAHSTLEAELYSVDEVAKQVVWARELLASAGVPQRGPTKVYTDSQGVLDVTRNPIHQARTKHFALRQDYIRHLVETEVLILEKIPSAENPADLGTKALPANQHFYLAEKFMG